MVSTVLSRYLHEERLSKAGIGHVRYSTHGGNKLENAQPIVVQCNKGEIAIAHNGNFSNTAELKNRLFEEGSIFQTSSDTELFLHLISRSRCPDFYSALVETLELIQGAYSMVLLHDDEVLAVRDPFGFRPLYMGRKDEMTIFASETCALDILQVTDFRAVDAGEIIRVNDQGIHTERLRPGNPVRQCVFELIYFARPDSQVFNNSVHERRKKMGAALAAEDRALAAEDRALAAGPKRRSEGSPHLKGSSTREVSGRAPAWPIGDIVVPVPDSGSSAAIGYAEESGIPFDFGLTRNHYAGRTFIMPTTAERELAVRMKLHPVRETIAGKRVILVDDSLVRGTTAKSLVKLLKEAGAKEVHLRLSSPEIRWPCFFGIDIPTRKELISNSLDTEAIARFIGAESVRFLKIETLKKCLDIPENYCFACFSGEYPMPVPLKEEAPELDFGRSNGRHPDAASPGNSPDATDGAARANRGTSRSTEPGSGVSSHEKVSR